MQITAPQLKTIAPGARIAIEFRAEAEDLENYAEPGMRAHLVSVDIRDDDLAILHVDFSEFDTYNQGFESANYYDKDRNPTLTARQAGYYHPQDTLYVSASEDLSGILVLLEDTRLQLFAEFQAGGAPSYVAWLEQQLIAARGA